MPEASNDPSPAKVPVFGFACPSQAKPSNFPIVSSSKNKLTQLSQGLVILALLGGVALADYVTGYEYTFFLFFLAPVLLMYRWWGQGAAFGMSLLAVAIWLAVNTAEGWHHSDWTMMLWETGVRLAVFLLILILVSNRNELQKLIQQRTEKLRREIEERTRLEKELLEIAEAEQRRIGQDLHDSLGQHLTATALSGKVLAKKLADMPVPESADAERLVHLMETAIEITRKLARNLHPVELRSDGLLDALQNLANNITQAFGVDCRLLHSGGKLETDVRISGQLFRIAQEAVSNAIRHGRATQVSIHLDVSGDKILLAITDNGQGLAADARSKNGLGLRIMDYRARMIGAHFDLQNRADGGARAVCILNPSHSDTEFYACKK